MIENQTRRRFREARADAEYRSLLVAAYLAWRKKGWSTGAAWELAHEIVDE